MYLNSFVLDRQREEPKIWRARDGGQKCCWAQLHECRHRINASHPNYSLLHTSQTQLRHLASHPWFVNQSGTTKWQMCRTSILSVGNFSNLKKKEVNENYECNYTCSMERAVSQSVEKSLRKWNFYSFLRCCLHTPLFCESIFVQLHTHAWRAELRTLTIATYVFLLIQQYSLTHDKHLGHKTPSF